MRLVDFLKIHNAPVKHIRQARVAAGFAVNMIMDGPWEKEFFALIKKYAKNPNEHWRTTLRNIKYKIVIK
jgi:hypothetical protein